MFDLISVGAIKLDTFIVLHEANVLCELQMPECKLCIAYGQKIPVEAFVTQIAGSAPNVAVGLGKMKLKTAILSILGDDDVKTQALAFLKRNKVNTSLITVAKNTRTSAAVVLNYKGESTQLVDHVPHEYRLPENLPETQFVHISELGHAYEKLYTDAMRLAKKGVKISLNPGSIQLRDDKKILYDLISVCEVLFVNISEARRLVSSANHDDQIHNLIASIKKLGPKYVVITDGGTGAYAYDGEQLDFVPAFPADRVEATGAGDAFSTGFLGALLKEKTHREALMWGSVNAASVVEKVGPTLGLLADTEIIKKLKAAENFTTKEL